MEVYKGEIWFVTKNNFKDSNTEDAYPALIVSNDTNNHFSNYVNVVRLTTQPKKPQPTHVEVECRNSLAVALCENINTVAKEKLTDYVRKINPEEIAAIDKALMLALDISGETDVEVIKALKIKVEETHKANCGLMERIDQQNALIGKLNAENDSLAKKAIAPKGNDTDLISLRTERDLYKHLYEQMLDRMIGA